MSDVALPPPRTVGPAGAAPFCDAGHGFDVFGLHPATLARTLAIGAPLYDHYFRVTSAGIDHIPAEGGAILVANHGGIVPVDAAMLCFDVLRRLVPQRIPRAVMDHFVPRLPIASTLLARCGAVSGTRANVRVLLERGELIVIFPEGVSGPAKPFRERYHLQAWKVGFAEFAIRYRAPIIPVAIVGAEESWPVLTKLGVRWFGVPFLPIPAWPIPLPARYHLTYGPAIRVDERSSHDADDPVIVAALAERVRAALARQLDDARMAKRGVFR